MRPILVRGIEVPAHIPPADRQNYADRMIEARKNTVVEVVLKFPPNPETEGMLVAHSRGAQYALQAIYAAATYAAGLVRQAHGTPPMEHQAVTKVLNRANTHAERVMRLAAKSEVNWSKALGEWAADQVLAESAQLREQLGGKSEHSRFDTGPHPPGTK